MERNSTRKGILGYCCFYRTAKTSHDPLTNRRAGNSTPFRNTNVDRFKKDAFFRVHTGAKQTHEVNSRFRRTVYDTEIWEEEDPKSDLTIDHHPLRNGEYLIVEDAEDSGDDDTYSGEWSWIVEQVDLALECEAYREACILKSKPKELDDVGVLAIKYVYVFREQLHESITRHFDCADSHHAIIKSLGVLEAIGRASPQVYDWHAQCASCTYTDWRELQSLTIKFLNKALESKNDLDLMVANVLHRILPLMKITGNASIEIESS